MIVVGAHIICNIYVCGPKKNLESYFSDPLTFSNTRGRTSHQIYRLALPLLSPEMLSSSSKPRIFLYNVHLALFVRMTDEGVHVSQSVIDLAPPTIGSVHFFQPYSTLLVKGLATPRLLKIWRRGKVQTGISVLGVLPPF